MSTKGFTLIELMIVIAIIAVIAAIAVPGLLSSQRAANERSASASLKTLATADMDFRTNDRDGNHIQDFWTLDVAGLYGIAQVDSTETIKLIELSVAAADFEASKSGVALPLVAGEVREVDLTAYAVQAPKAGYWFKAMTTDETGAAYALPTNGIKDNLGAPNDNPWYNFGKFAFLSFPNDFTSGRSAFFVNESNTIFKRPCTGPVKLNITVPGNGAPLLFNTAGLVGDHPAEVWPRDVVLSAQYSKLD